MGCLCSAFINYRLLSSREMQMNSGGCVTDLAGPHLLTLVSVGGVLQPCFLSRHLHVSSRSSRKEICSLRESILSSCWREWDRRLIGSVPTSSGADGMRSWKGASTNWSFCGQKGRDEHVLPQPAGCSMLGSLWGFGCLQRAAGLEEQCGVQLGSLQREASVVLKIELGRREGNPGCKQPGEGAA